MRISITTSWADARLGAFGMSARSAVAPMHAAVAAPAVAVSVAAEPREYGDANGASGALFAWGPPV